MFDYVVVVTMIFFVLTILPNAYRRGVRTHEARKLFLLGYALTLISTASLGLYFRDRQSLLLASIAYCLVLSCCSVFTMLLNQDSDDGRGGGDDDPDNDDPDPPNFDWPDFEKKFWNHVNKTKELVY